MEIVNASGLVVGVTLGLRPDGREHAVVCAKGTFRFPRGEGEAVAVEPEARQPLRTADAFTGEPGQSAPTFESDYAPYKPACDVLIVGRAHAPGYRPSERVVVGVRVGTMLKSFAAVGERTWEPGRGGLEATRPRPFATLPITYDRAFGGAGSAENPVGLGHPQARTDAALVGTALPSFEEEDRPVTDPYGAYRALALGPIGRGWQPRVRHAGTYDEAWREGVFPFLPADFDERYHQAAPPDQQVPHPTGGELVALLNLTPAGTTRLRLPPARLPVALTTRRGERRALTAVVDTLVIEPEERRLTMVFRASTPLRQGLIEVARIVFGQEGGA
jgi:hypothetical protein